MTRHTNKQSPERLRQESHTFDPSLGFIQKAYVKKSHQSKFEQSIALMVFIRNIHKAENLPNSKV